MLPRDPQSLRPIEAAPIFAALGDSTRLGLLLQLCHRGPRSIAELTKESDVTRQAITKHLRALEAAGLARAVRMGRSRVWRLETRRLGEIRHYLDEISRQWDDVIERLRQFVETERH